MRLLRMLAVALTLASPSMAAEAVVAGLSQDSISITTNFEGSEILIYGAVKREERIPATPPLEVLITVEGPSEPLTVRRKEKRFGIWVNTDFVEVDRAPSFYAVATSGPWDDVIRDIEDLRHRISIRRAIRSVGATIEGSRDFTDALMRIRSRADLYQTNIGTIQVAEQTLFNTSFQLPANLTEGDYVVRFFLTRDGTVVATQRSIIAVQKVGLEQFLFNLAHEQAVVYGLMSLAIAIAAGWGASAAFALIRR